MTEPGRDYTSAFIKKEAGQSHEILSNVLRADDVKVEPVETKAPTGPSVPPPVITDINSVEIVPGEDFAVSGHNLDANELDYVQIRNISSGTQASLPVIQIVTGKGDDVLHATTPVDFPLGPIEFIIGNSVTGVVTDWQGGMTMVSTYS